MDGQAAAVHSGIWQWTGEPSAWLMREIHGVSTATPYTHKNGKSPVWQQKFRRPRQGDWATLSLKRGRGEGRRAAACSLLCQNLPGPGGRSSDPRLEPSRAWWPLECPEARTFQGLGAARVTPGAQAVAKLWLSRAEVSSLAQGALAMPVASRRASLEVFVNIATYLLGGRGHH